MCEFIFSFIDPVEASELNKVGPCGMGAGSKCGTIIGLWAVGFTGYCINGPMGFRFGGDNVYKQAAMEVIKLSAIIVDIIMCCKFRIFCRFKNE